MNRGRRSIVVVVLGWILWSGAACAAEESPIAALLYDDAFLVARIDLAKVQVRPLYELLDRTIGQGAFPARRVVEPFVARLREAGAKELYLVWGGDTGILFVPLAEGISPAAIEAALRAHPLRQLLPVETTERIAGGVAAGRATMLMHLRDFKAAPRPGLISALAATSDCTVQLLLVPTQANRPRARAFEWPMLQLAATRAATEHLAWASIGLDGPPQPRLKMKIEAQDGASVEPLQTALGNAVEPILNDRAVNQNLALVENLRTILSWQRSGNGLELDLDDRAGKLTVVARGMVQPVLQPAMAAKAQPEAVNKIKQIGIALLNHHDVFKKFPAPAMLDAEGKPLLSWRVKILPFIDEGALYKRFHLDEPWDSPHNKPLLAEMPDIFRCPLADVADDSTVFLASRGEGATFGGAAAISIRNIIDGTSKTIGIVEAADEHAVPWTKPDDWSHDPDQPTAGLGGHFGEKFLAGALDSSAHEIPLSFDTVRMRALLTFSGREPEAFPDR